MEIYKQQQVQANNEVQKFRRDNYARHTATIGVGDESKVSGSNLRLCALVTLVAAAAEAEGEAGATGERVPLAFDAVV